MRVKFAVLFAISVVFSFAGCASSGGGGGGGGGGADASPPECEDGATQCVGNSFQTCAGGAWDTTAQCPQRCDNDLGCVECAPERNHCSGNDVYACNADGTRGSLVESCGEDLQCQGGACVDLCAEAAESRSYIGCEYWAVDLDNAVEVLMPADSLFGCGVAAPGAEMRDDIEVCHDGSQTAGECDAGGQCPQGYDCTTTPVCVLDAQHSPFAIVVSNPQEMVAQVTIESQDGQSQAISVNPGEVTAFYPQDAGFADQSVDGSGIGARGYKITSKVPIVAYQFNPLDNVDVFSNDGSLLIPRHAFDAEYLALTWPTLNRRPETNDYNSYVTVVSWADGTEVQITPAADTRAGVGGFSPLSAGGTATFTLDAFDVLSVEAVAGGDLTGTRIESVDGAATFGVFAGHEAVMIQHTQTSCCADHVEEMMFPNSTWGKDYVIARSKDRGMGEPDTVRILAQTDGTTVSVNPPAQSSCPTLDAGEFCEIEITTDVEVSSDQPILVGHYLQSVIEGGLFGPAEGTGDPALSLAVPSEQYRDTYTFLVPMQYAEQYVSVVAHEGATVTLGSEDVSDQFTTFGSGDWATARLPVSPGQHIIDCTGGCGLEVYGYDEAVSYLFAGGLDLNRIVVD